MAYLSISLCVYLVDKACLPLGDPHKRGSVTKFIKKDREGHYIIMRTNTRDITFTFINIYSPNRGVPKHITQILTDIKRNVDRTIIIVGDFDTLLTALDKSFRQKINKATEILNDTIDLLDLTDICRTLHLNKPRIHILLKWMWTIL